jgi:CxxC motif-containing protein (DUF1111 family)
MAFKLGNALFRKIWVVSPPSTLASDGLAPLYSACACQDCHLKEGRGHAPEEQGGSCRVYVLRLSVSARSALGEIEVWIATANEPIYDGQLQDFASPGLPAEEQMQITYTELETL